jgi:hypothetical protein
VSIESASRSVGGNMGTIFAYAWLGLFAAIVIYSFINTLIISKAFRVFAFIMTVVVAMTVFIGLKF